MKPNVYWIPGPWPGRLAILARPRGGDWLQDEIKSWREAGIQVVVSLLSNQEASDLALADEAELARRSGVAFINFPIDDYGVPSSQDAVRQLINELERLLEEGQSVAIHCRQGIGRSSLVVACLLVTTGQDVDTSFEKISHSRGFAVPDTLEQRKWVGDFARINHVA